MIRVFILLLAAVTAAAGVDQPAGPIRLSPEAAAREGRALVEKILSDRPAQEFTNTGVLKTVVGKKRVETPMRSETRPARTGWYSRYEAGKEGNRVILTVLHADGRPNEYRLSVNGAEKVLSGNDSMIPFADSDFWIADLGLEFFHWPNQRLIRKEIRRGQSCDVLESINPHPVPGAYSRVISWIDADSDGIINAEAFDSNGRLLKEFIAKSFKKVHGQWQLETIEMDNRQTGSRTWIDFEVR